MNGLTDFSNKMKDDLIGVGAILKEQLAPMADGLKSMFDNMFSSFLSSFQAKQQQDNLLVYLPIGLVGVSILYIINKK